MSSRQIFAINPCWNGEFGDRSHENDPQLTPKRGQGSPKRVLPHLLIQTLVRNRPKNDPRENLENGLNERWIPTKRLKRRIRYETAAKMQKIGCKPNAWTTENTIFVEPSLKTRVFTAVLCPNVHSHRCFAHTVFDKCYKIPKKISKSWPKMPEGSKNGLDAENTINTQSKCQSRAHFAHVFEPQPFSKTTLQKTIFRRYRMQQMPSEVSFHEFSSCLVMFFQSTAKPQREAQNGRCECTIWTFNGLL